MGIAAVCSKGVCGEYWLQTLRHVASKSNVVMRIVHRHHIFLVHQNEELLSKQPLAKANLPNYDRKQWHILL